MIRPLDESQVALQNKAADLATFLMAYEETVDQTEIVSPKARDEIAEAVRSSGLGAMNMPEEWGGGGFSLFDQVLVMEQLGKVTNSLWTLVWHPANVLAHCSPEQRERYLLPSIEGRLRDCFSVTEPGAGSDVRSITTTAVETANGYRINGEKLFASGSDTADFIVLLAKVEPGSRYTLFLVDQSIPGKEIGHMPRLTSPGPQQHPQVVYKDLHVTKDAVLGEVGGGFDLTKEWFVDERLYIAARCVGGAERALTLTTKWAKERNQFGKPLIEHQLVQANIADCAVEIALNRSLTYQVAAEADAGADRKLLHAKAAMVKFAASEAAGRVLDRCVQLFGGRGQMRENPVERLSRGLRPERIWEGATDIQRLIVGNHVRKRGLEGLLAPATAQSQEQPKLGKDADRLRERGGNGSSS